MIDYVEEKAAITSFYYKEQIRRLWWTINDVWCDLQFGFRFALAAVQEPSYELLKHQPYSLDLAPAKIIFFLLSCNSFEDKRN